jgi:hypothetical protein
MQAAMPQYPYRFGRNPSDPEKLGISLDKFSLERFLTPALPTLPKTCNQAAAVKLPYGELLNDRLGDCCAAACGHMDDLWTADCGAEKVVTDPQILTFYEGISGYVPSDPATDVGSDGITTLNYWRKTGLAGRKIDAYMNLAPPAEGRAAAVEAAWQHRVQAGIFLFGAVWLGVSLPFVITEGLVDPLAIPWNDNHGGKGQWAPDEQNGGHALMACAYSAVGLTLVTWGAVKSCSWGFAHRYCSNTYQGEAYACLSSEDWLKGGKSPQGFDLPALKAALAAL